MIEKVRLCLQFEDLAHEKTASAEAAALWSEHRETCSDCLEQERLDVMLREALKGDVPAARGKEFTDRVLGQLPEAVAQGSSARSRLLLFLYGGFALAASALILAQLPAPLFDPKTLRVAVLGSTLLSPLILIRKLRHAVTRLLAAP
jgi:hypothetical protein